jgi:2-dehydro-3-deoxygluconokinase
MSAQVACLGESMAVLVPDAVGPGYGVTVGGAESNTACALAGLGVRAAWIGRVGDDRFGRLILDTLTGRGVDVSGVEVDPVRPTGLYVKEITEAGTRLRYYRSGSAASAMSGECARSAALRAAPFVHLTGITAALSDGCGELVAAILAAPRSGVHPGVHTGVHPARRVSFDLNWRPALWRERDPAVLLTLARRADLVFVGADEAAELWGTGEPQRIRDLLPEPATVVVKLGADGAVGFGPEGAVSVPAPRVEVVEPTGAGDAFAAGYLAGVVRGLPLRARLRLGCLTAASALLVRGDLGAAPDPRVVARHLGAADGQWAALRLTPADFAAEPAR